MPSELVVLGCDYDRSLLNFLGASMIVKADIKKQKKSPGENCSSYKGGFIKLSKGEHYLNRIKELRKGT